MLSENHVPEIRVDGAVKVEQQTLVLLIRTRAPASTGRKGERRREENRAEIGKKSDEKREMR